MRIAINGFGRIGRCFFKQAFDTPDITISAINDLGEPDNLGYLLKYDTVYGRYKKNIEIKHEKTKFNNIESVGKMIIEDKEVLIFCEKEPSLLPWGELNIDVVVESTGAFTQRESAEKHLEAGAKRVVISAPATDDIPHILVGANNDKFFEAKVRQERITSNASCTTNSIVPLISILEENLGIIKGMMTTIHAYTATQGIVDGPGKKGDFLRGRAAAQNIVPSHTGAAESVIRSLPYIANRFDALAIRVPVLTGSLIDFTFLSKRKTTVEEVNNIFKKAAEDERWRRTVKVSEVPLVSSDIIGEPYGSIIDLTLTKVLDGDLVKVFSWYDNEWGYCATLLEHILKLA